MRTSGRDGDRRSVDRRLEKQGSVTGVAVLCRGDGSRHRRAVLGAASYDSLRGIVPCRCASPSVYDCGVVTMLRFPRLKTFLSVFPLTATTWGLRGGGDELWRIKLTDARAVRAFGALLPYLNGRTSTDDILRLAESDGCHRGAATAVLRQLEAAFLLEEAGDDGLSEADVRTFDDQIRFFSRFGQQGGAKLQSVLRSSLVALAADGAVGQSVYGRLAGAGFGEVTVLSREPVQASRWIERTPEPRPITTVLELDAESVWPEAIDVPRLLI